MSLCPHEIRRDVLPPKIGRGAAPNVIPAILLARLALDRRLHGEGLGAQLLVDAVGRAVDAVRLAGGRFIVVDALHDRAAGFYLRFGFQEGPEVPLRLVMKASDAAASLGLPWP
jgi:GNAT superfamily N-acetyltransferase